MAVSDHTLLGGDNVDLAIAHLLEPRLTGERGKLSGTGWDDLVARCRDLKERLLTSDGGPDEPLTIALPGRGSGLFAAMRTAQLTRAEIQAVLLDGFFPECSAQAYPYRTQAALKEWGLPYASDCAVTRHLADFLRGRPRIDAILFNGGSLRPEFLRERICQQVAKWQGGLPPLALENADPELAVAHGAKSLAALAIVVGVAVLREGFEVVLFLYGVAVTEGGANAGIFLGGLAGLVLGALVCVLTYNGLLKIPMQFFILLLGGCFHDP